MLENSSFGVMGLVVRFVEPNSWFHMPALADPFDKNTGVMAKVPVT